MSGLRFDSTVHRMFIKMPATSQSGSHIVRLITMVRGLGCCRKARCIGDFLPWVWVRLTRQTVPGLKTRPPTPNFIATKGLVSWFCVCSSWSKVTRWSGDVIWRTVKKNFNAVSTTARGLRCCFQTTCSIFIAKTQQIIPCLPHFLLLNEHSSRPDEF